MADWNRIDPTPIPLSIGRIWLSDEQGNVRRAMSWTWPMLKRHEPGKYRNWMVRVHGAKQPPVNAVLNAPRPATAWNEIDKAPIPINVGRIWLADIDGNVVRAMSWTWPILKRRQPRKFRRWMVRVQGAPQPSL